MAGTRKPTSQTTSLNGKSELSVCSFDAGFLPGIVPQWNFLVENAADPNSFYEPWFLLPAIEWLSESDNFFCLGVFDEKKLVGMFPMVQSRRCGGARSICMWKHELCFLTTPHVYRGYESQVTHALLGYVKDHFPGHCVEWPLLQSWSGIGGAMVDARREWNFSKFISDEYRRAILNRDENWEATFESTVSGHHRREYRRQRKKLEGLGQFEFRTMKNPNQAGQWASWFLELEAQGWKADQGTAMAQSNRQKEFFKQMVKAGSEQGAVEFLGFFINGEPIALKCNLISQPGAFGFKIAYDESLHKYSPGVLLELEYMRHFQEDTDLKWVDSCASPDHPMVDRIWSDRRTIQQYFHSTGNLRSECAIGMLSLLRSLKRGFSNR